MIKPIGDFLILNNIHFQEKIRNTEKLKFPAVRIKPAELDMAIQLITQLTTDFDISRFKNTYNEKLLKLIMAKAKGKKPVTPKLQIVRSKADDLMAQLKESLSASKQKAS